jgi:predicted ATPase
MDITLSNYRCFSDEHPVRIELRKGLTAFVGPNNSGKSALLRFFYEFRQFFDLVATDATLLNLAIGQSVNGGFPPEVLDVEEVFPFTNGREIRIRVVQEECSSKKKPPTVIVARNSRSMQLEFDGIAAGAPRQVGTRLEGTFLISGSVWIKLSDIQGIFLTLHEALYIGAFRNALNKGGDAQNYFDMPVGQHFISEWANSQAGNVKQLNKAATRVVGDIKEIFGFENLAINSSPNNQGINFVINDRPLKDHEVGSGLTQVLMVLHTVAIKQPSYILIDEPELNLHPSLQVKFLLALASYARYGVLFGTHSVGLAKTVADRIFSVQQFNDGHSEIRRYEETRNLAELLGEMSFSAYREMGFEKILLVEGRTDVRVVQQFLRLRKKDNKIVPVALGGKSMICADSHHELAELKRLCDYTYALIDSERKSEGEEIETPRKAFVETCTRLGIVCKVLDRRATENYLPARAIKEAFPNHPYKELGPYEKLGDVQPSWGKTENWRVASEITKDELLNTDLGKFLQEI